MDLKTRVEILPCGTCEDMMNCDDCYHQKDAKDLYQQIRADAIDEYKYALLNLIHQIPQKCIGGANVKEVAKQLKEQTE